MNLCVGLTYTVVASMKAYRPCELILTQLIN
jgi:hypothetical protein